MDRITAGLLAEFVRENDLGNLPQDTQFEHFTAYLAISRYVADTFDTADVVTGSGNDTGLDAIAVVVNGSIVTDSEFVPELAKMHGSLDVTFVFVQAERSSSFSTAKIGTFAYGASDFFNETSTLTRNEGVENAARVMSAIYEESPRFKHGNPTCHLVYATTGRRRDEADLDARQNSAIEDLQSTNLFKKVSFTRLGSDEIRHLYNQSKNAVVKTFEFVSKTALPEMPQVTEAYVGFLPAPEFLSLLTDEDGNLIRSLFYENVRDWQHYNVVNTGIRGTLDSQSERSRFVLMNNGITVIAKELRATGNRFRIEDFQIVNGCQTSHVLFDVRDQLDNATLVPLRLIATQDDDVIASIVKATNRQTQVKEEQLLALSDFQKKLELYFASFDERERLYYERRSKQFSNATGVEKTRIITPPNLIRAFASVFLEEPHRTTRNFRALLDKVGAEIFASEDKLIPYYLSASILYRLEFLFRNGEIEKHLKAARYHILLACRLLSSPSPVPPMNSREMERYCKALVSVYWDLNKAKPIFEKAVQIVEETADGDFHRDNIRTQPFTDRLVQRCKAR